MRVRRAGDSISCIDGLSEATRATGRAEEKIWDAFNSVPSLLGGSNEGEKVKRTPSREARQYKLCWTSTRRYRGLAVVRREGSLKMGTAVGHDKPRRGS